MTDREYLTQALQRGHLCPTCRQKFLDLKKEGATCPGCRVTYPTFKALFQAIADDLAWGVAEGWKRWLDEHPDYEEGT